MIRIARIFEQEETEEAESLEQAVLCDLRFLLFYFI